MSCRVFTMGFWGKSCMLLEVFAEGELLGEIEFLGNLLDVFVSLFKKYLGVGYGNRSNPLRGGLPRSLLDD